MPTDDIISARDAAELLGLNSRTIRRWMHDGRLTPAGKLTGPTGAYLFHRSDIEALADELAAEKTA